MSEPSLDLEELVAASREPSRTAWVLQNLPHLAALLRQTLQDVEDNKCREDNAQEAPQTTLLQGFRVLRNAAAVGGPPACAAALQHGLLHLVCSTLDLIGTAAIPLNWQLPTAVAQAMANLCTACTASAAAAWAALFPLHLAMLAHVNTGARGV